MTKMNSSIIMLVLVVCMIFAGCTKENMESEPIATNILKKEPLGPNRNTNQSNLVGSVKVENVGSDTNVMYTFKNQSEKIVNVIGGARYRLIKNNKEVDEGVVPTKDYIDLEPGQDYTDIKTFSKLKPGSYTIHVEWNKTIVSAEFVQN
ncbi:hypothetical protein [Paenibacillus sp. FSL H8-0079]|uniref:hypothetical protein n=1 Tax=Paenibacillus sp. FSL H8-0079 TaxID=2921375 RepID=UPI0030EC3087